MNKRILLLVGMLSLLVLVFILSSCDNEDLGNNELLDESTFVENVLETVVEDSEIASSVASLSTGRFGFGGGQCITRTVEGTDSEYPKIITLDYGTNCDSVDGISTNGKIIITVTGDLKESGSSKIIVFEEFSVNGYQISGTITHSRETGSTYRVVVDQGQIISPDGSVATYESIRTRTQVSGLDTDTRDDDVFEITGSSSGVDFEGTIYAKEIVQPLVKRADCKWIVQGLIQKTSGDNITTYDFGDGTCDNLALLTENGETEEIEMNFRAKRRIRR